ncbi:MAG TPA: low specificity L-threonine aldolase [Rhodocyclaceae bacterium]
MPAAETPGWKLQFASDNTAGACPEALAALAAANAGFVASYGSDAWTHQVCDRLRTVFETDCDIYFVFNGTAANSLALASLCQSYHGVICSESAHVETDECGAPEFFSNGSKLLTAPQREGQISPESVAALVKKRSDIHFPRPRAVSLTQATEFGTVYSPAQVAAIAAVARADGLHVHMDGARFANAVAGLGVSPADLTWRAGVDVLCFGGTKMGLPIGEAVVFFDRRLGEEFAYRCKQAGQLASKMRVLSAPWLAMLDGDTWLHRAAHANAQAQALAARFAAIPGVRLAHPVQANGVFAELPAGAGERLRHAGWMFHDFIGGASRFMCSWATEDEAVDALANDLARAVAAT